MVDAYRKHLVAEGRLKGRTINKYLLVMHAIFRRAQREWGLAQNPVAGVERQPVRRSAEFRVLAPEEVAALARVARAGNHRVETGYEYSPEVRAAHEAQDLQDAVLFTVAAFAGLRLGEIRGLRWRDVDFPKALIHIRRAFTVNGETTPKSGHARAVPMIDQVAGALDELSRRDQWVGEDDLVFVSPTGEYLEDAALRRRFYRALQAAEIKPLSFHDLRHSFGTLAVQVFPLSDVMRSSHETTRWSRPTRGVAPDGTRLSEPHREAAPCRRTVPGCDADRDPSI